MTGTMELALELAQPRNFFELRVISWPCEQRQTVGASVAMTGLGLEIWVDGQHLDEHHPIDLPRLVQSLHEPGWFDISTCGCGVGACAGIAEGIDVRHEMGVVRWSFRRPQTVGSLSDSAVNVWEKTAVPIVFNFERRQMVTAIQKCLHEIADLVAGDLSRFDWYVNGLSTKEILSINPHKAFYEKLGGE